MIGLFMALCGVMIGMWIGFVTEAHRWRANADAIQRIESGGHLYKVEHA